MKSEAVSGVQPKVIKWAREATGLSLEDVATRLKKPIAVVQGWESGEAMPTYVQLETLAYELYKRPLAIFFLPEPPQEKRPAHEFRSLPETDLESLAPNTRLHIRKAQAYQVSLRQLYGDGNPSDTLISDVVSLSLNDSVERQAIGLRKSLGITIERQAKWTSDEEALRNWRQIIEDAGVFVFKDSFKQKEISGFCLQDQMFPIIYINNSTTKTRQIFSLLHELAHLLFHVNGLSKFDKEYIEHLPITEQRIEVFCNAIAAEVLIPNADLELQIRNLPKQLESVPESVFSALAKRYGVSREAILRRFLNLGRVTKPFYEAKAKEWTQQMQKNSKGGNWLASTGAYLSDRFLKEVITKHYRQQINVEQAADLLGIKAKNFSGLEELVLKRVTA